MKLWIRLLAGAGIGVFLGVVLPLSGGDTVATLAVISRIVVNIGRYALFPLVFFGLASGIRELNGERRIGWVFLKTIGLVVVSTVLFVLVGTLLILALAPERIPPIYQETAVPQIPSVAELLESTFPRNLFAVFAAEGSFLLPIYVLAIVLGLILADERSGGGAIAELVDSGSSVFYRLNSIVVDLLAIGLVIVTTLWVTSLRSVADLRLFLPLAWVLIGAGGFFVLIVYPLALFLLADRASPFAWLFGTLPAAIVALFAGDGYFALGTLSRVQHENLGVSRSVGAVTLPLGVLIARAGTAMVISASFLMVLRSYTALEVTFGQVLWLILTGSGVSLLLGSAPGAAVLVGLSALSAAFGRGMEEIYLILIPVMPLITGIAVLLDVATNSFITTLVAHTERHRHIVDTRDFV